MDPDKPIKVDFGEGDANLKVSTKEDPATIKPATKQKQVMRVFMQYKQL